MSPTEIPVVDGSQKMVVLTDSTAHEKIEIPLGDGSQTMAISTDSTSEDRKGEDRNVDEKTQKVVDNSKNMVDSNSVSIDISQKMVASSDTKCNEKDGTDNILKKIPVQKCL